jgi:hypothetical protein
MAPTRALTASTNTPPVSAATPGSIATPGTPAAIASVASPTTNAGDLARGNLVGRTSDPDAFIGIVVTGDDVVAYVCDGENLAQWFTGTVQGDQIALTAQNGAQLTASVKETAGTSSLQAASGTFRDASGQSLSFNSSAANDLGMAGLYRGTSTSGSNNLTMGVIVLPDGDLRGVLWTGQQQLPVTNPTFVANGLNATFPGFGTISAQRLGT